MLDSAFQGSDRFRLMLKPYKGGVSKRVRFSPLPPISMKGGVYMLMIVDSENGSVLREIHNNELVDFTRQNLADYLENTKEVYMPSFSKIDNRIFTDVKVSNYKALVSLIALMNGNDGILRIKNRMVGKTKLSQHINDIPPRTIRKVIEQLLEQDVLKEFVIDRRIYYRMNPYLCSRGKRVKKELFEAFEGSEWNRATNKRHNTNTIKTKENEQDGLIQDN